MKILATIAARAGSKGAKGKNARNLLGKPLISYTIEQLLRWGKFDAFIVSTDSEDIADIARRHGVDVPFMRPAELSTDITGKQDVLRHALIAAEKHYSTRFDGLLDCDATAPIRTVHDIERIVEIFKDKQPNCIFSVIKARKNPYFNMVEIQNNGLAMPCKRLARDVKRRQDAPVVYQMNASLYIYRRDFLLDSENTMPYSKGAMVYEMEEESAFDIDSEFDFKLIEFLMRERQQNDIS